MNRNNEDNLDYSKLMHTATCWELNDYHTRKECICLQPPNVQQRLALTELDLGPHGKVMLPIPDQEQGSLTDFGEIKHGQEGTHFCCDARIKAEGGKARCCACRPHGVCELWPVSQPTSGQDGDINLFMGKHKSTEGMVQLPDETPRYPTDDGKEGDK